jgi:FlaA1/EpsC-like NDP-sugar epimerase
LNNNSNAINSFLESPRTIKRIISLGYDSAVILLSAVLALDISLPNYNYFALQSYNHYLVTLIVSLIIFAKVGFYRAILRYMGLKAVLTIALGIVLSTLVFVASCLFFETAVNTISVLL